MLRLPLLRLSPGGSLGTPKILSTGATLHLEPISLHVENWECRALKSLARCQKFGVPCTDFFSTCKWGLHVVTHLQKDMLITAEQIQKPTRQCPNLLEISWDIGKLIC